MANRNSRRSRNRYSGANNSNKMKISAADKSALSGAVGGGGGGGGGGGAPSSAPSAPTQTGGSGGPGGPGSIASSPFIPPIKLKTFTDLFSGKTNFFTLQSPAADIMNSRVLTAMHNFFHNLNTSTFFAGFVMLILNIGSRYINLDLHSSTESWIKYFMSKEVLVFAVSWMGTRSIYYALVITACFTVIVDHFMNVDSNYCIIPQKFKGLHKMTEEKKGPEKTVSDLEISNALHTLEKAKKEKEEKDHIALVKYHHLFKDDTFESMNDKK
jgi:hypothetical protein